MLIRIHFALLASLTCQTAFAFRPHISEEELNSRIPIIFEGQILEAKEVKAPTHDFYLYDQTQALAVKLKVLKSWKGLHQDTVVIYTWPRGKAPCPDLPMPVQGKALVRAQWDRTKKFVLFDLCRNFAAVDGFTKSSIELLDRMFPNAESKSR